MINLSLKYILELLEKFVVGVVGGGWVGVWVVGGLR